jgi:hypothetical protein
VDLSKLQTLAQANARPHATPKHELSTKLDRAIAKKAATRVDDVLLAKWAIAVKDLDGWKDRRTGKRLTRTRDLDPLRAEAHHIVSRDDEAVRYDIRNGICLSYATHDAVERNQLRIVGTVFFMKGNRRYINGRFAVRFKEIA